MALKKKISKQRGVKANAKKKKNTKTTEGKKGWASPSDGERRSLCVDQGKRETRGPIKAKSVGKRGGG